MAMTRYDLGDIGLVRFVDGELDIDAPGPAPDWSLGWLAPSVDRVTLAFAAYGVEVHGLRVIVDPWLVTDGARQAPDAADHAGRLETELTEAGFAPDSVDLVLFSHVDGIGWAVRPDDGGDAPMFPKARHVLSAPSLSAVESGDIERPAGWDALLDTVSVDWVETDERLSEAVRLQTAEGHSPGHVVVRVRTDQVDLALTGHLFQFPNQVGDPSIANDTDPTQAETERRRLLGDLAETDGLLFGQLLGGAGGGRVVDQDGTYRLDEVRFSPSAAG